MAKRAGIEISEEELLRRDAQDPLFKMLDEGKLSQAEIFQTLGWEPMPADLFDEQ